MIDVPNLLVGLARERPVFQSEADFQHALAWRIHETHPAAKIRPEYKPFPEERVSVDVWISGEEPIAIELKYFTRGLTTAVDGERFVLKSQNAQDTGRYDALKDITRLETIVSKIPMCSGYAIVLTNDPLYWKPPAQDDTFDAAFRIHESRSIGGTLRWSERASKGTTSEHEAPLELSGTYRAAWRDYATASSDPYARFRYLLVEVTPFI